MSRIVSSLLIFLLLLIIATDRAFAVGTDLVVECKKDARCDVLSQPSPLFEGVNFVPGQMVRQTITVNNKSLQDCGLTLKIFPDEEDSNNLGQAMLMSFYNQNGEAMPFASGQVEEYLADNWQGEFISLGFILAKEIKTITWQFRFDPSVGNEFQGQSATFDTDLIFECDQDLAEVATDLGQRAMILMPEPTPMPDCDDVYPAQVPELLEVELGSNQDSANLTWTEVPKAQYVLEFGPSDGSATFKHVGITTTEYRVGQLDPNSSYTFGVRAQIGCAVGALSNLLSTASNAVPLSDVETTFGGETAFDAGEVLGTSDINDANKPLENEKLGLWNEKKPVEVGVIYRLLTTIKSWLDGLIIKIYAVI